jgi:uncharacterized protein (TIGR00369 family)
MKKPNPEHIARLISIINKAPYFAHLSMKLHEIGVGHARFEIELNNKHHQPFGVVHGGVLASIIDSAACWALFYGIEDQYAGMTSVDLKLNYLAPAVTGILIAKGRQIKLGRTLGYAEAEVTDANGKILAHGTSTVMVLPGKAPLADPPLPPKFTDNRSISI